ncbi:tyrosine-type recombinase/integrase [Nocardia asiatica]|uniref:tyrosine-type recombinase/integrase n=1 Tax=Nocardia asiatica TaxID=209252 RepID=UPI00245593CB|nr:tyrosine-type recombinase/integrase [Nocardia asiatica]
MDDDLQVVGCADEFLRHLRFGQDCAEGTVAAYASSVSLFLRWCQMTSRDWRQAGAVLGSFILWLRFSPDPGSPEVLVGPGMEPVRSERRVNAVLTAVRGLLVFAVTMGEAPAQVMSQIYEVGDTRDLPVELRGEGVGGLPRAKARHRLSEPDTTVDRATDKEAIELLRACRRARDRFILLLLARAGLRRGESVGLRRNDLHFVVDATVLGCEVPGAHLHVIRRTNPNGAWAKSRHVRTVPADWLLVQAYDQWWFERQGLQLPVDSDFVLVNISRGQLGEPMKPGALNELLERLSGRAGLSRVVHPHMLRHAFASNVLDAGGSIDEVQALLGHQSIRSTQIYSHPDYSRQRAAIERVPAARALAAGREAQR